MHKPSYFIFQVPLDSCSMGDSDNKLPLNLLRAPLPAWQAGATHTYTHPHTVPHVLRVESGAEFLPVACGVPYPPWVRAPNSQRWHKSTKDVTNRCMYPAAGLSCVCLRTSNYFAVAGQHSITHTLSGHGPSVLITGSMPKPTDPSSGPLTTAHCPRRTSSIPRCRSQRPRS